MGRGANMPFHPPQIGVSTVIETSKRSTSVQYSAVSTHDLNVHIFGDRRKFGGLESQIGVVPHEMYKKG